MKKTIFAAVFAMAAVFGGFQNYASASSVGLSDMAKANVEALLESNENELNRGRYIPIDYDTNDVQTGENGETIITITHHRRCMSGGNQSCSRYDVEETIVL